MNAHLHTLTAHAQAGVVLAADTASAPSWLNTAAIVGFCVFLASIFALVLGLSMMGQSKKGNIKEAAAQSGVGLLGLIWVALGVGGTIVTVAAATLGFFMKG